MNSFGHGGLAFGSLSSIDTSRILVEKARAAFYDALTLFPDETKQGLLEALRIDPELVARESNCDTFLRSEDYNVWRAASKYVAYWEERKRVFGHRFCLPMNLSGNGTLTEEDINVIRLGVAVVLPNDSEGSPVVRWDRSKVRSCSDFTVRTRSRVVFFFLHELSRLQDSQVHGVVAVVALQNPEPMRFFKGSGCKYALDQIASIFPMKLKKVIVFFPPLFWDKLRMLEFLLRPILRAINSSYDLVLIKRGLAEEYATELEARGLARGGIPTDMGGDWAYGQDFHVWLKARLFEERKPRGEPGVGDLLHFASSVAKLEDKESKRKKMGLIYSKRKRVRQKLRFEILENEEGRAHVLNAKLKSENERLKALVKAAKKVAKWYEEDGNSPPPHVEALLSSVPETKVLELDVLDAHYQAENRRMQEALRSLDTSQIQMFEQSSTPVACLPPRPDTEVKSFALAEQRLGTVEHTNNGRPVHFLQNLSSLPMSSLPRVAGSATSKVDALTGRSLASTSRLEQAVLDRLEIRKSLLSEQLMTAYRPGLGLRKSNENS